MVDDPDAAWRPPSRPVSTETVDGLSDLVEIARGGDSIVYRAHQAALGRDVAVKVLLVDDPDTVARFEREIALTVSLGRQHPNIVTLLDVGTTASGRPCLVMDLFERGSLGDRLRTEGALPIADVLAVGVVVADALDFAHSQGVLHRDVKPQNILVLPTSFVLADFGIARLADAAHTASAERFSYRHASPQVLDGHPATTADDLWSLGSTLYTLVDGRPPFASDDPDDDTPLAYLRRVRTASPRPLERPDLPEGLGAAIARCLAPARDDRFPDARAVHDELSRVRAGLQAWAPGPTSPYVVPPAPAADGAVPPTRGHGTAVVPPPEPSEPFPPAEPAGSEPAEPAPSDPSDPTAPTRPITPTSISPSAATSQSAAISPSAPATPGAPATSSTVTPSAPSALSHAGADDRDGTPTGRTPDADGVAALVTAPTASPPPRRLVTKRLVVSAAALLVLGIAVSTAYSIGQLRRQPTSSASAPTSTPAGTTGTPVPTLTGSPTTSVDPLPPVADPALAPEFTDLRVTGTGVVLTWSDPSKGTGTFVVTQTSPGAPQAVRSIPAGVTTTTISGLAPGSGERCYVVLVITGSGTGTSKQRCATL